MRTEQKEQQYILLGNLLEKFKNLLSPSQPLPHIFLNLVTTENWRSPEFQGQYSDPRNLQIIASLQINRHEVVPPTRIGCTQDLIANFGDWYENYTKYAIDYVQYALRDDVNNTGDYSNRSPNNFRRFDVNEEEEESSSRREYSIEEASERVERSINYLFNQSNEFKEIRNQLIQALPPKDQPQPDVYIRYDDPLLAELPLHLWDEFQERNIEPVFCSLKTSLQNISFKKKEKPRILLILGDFVDIDNDNEMLNWQKKYPDAEIEVLEMLNQRGVSDALWDGKWDVLYFGGHSTTQDGKGIIYLKDGMEITLGNFKKGLAKAAKNGLQLAIFNSCISLGAASDLQSAGVPMVVATRHKMHNFIAPEFLKYFLDAYIKSDMSIKDAVWYARERLKTDTPYFPCANWLPVVFQIPTVIAQPKPSPTVAIATSFFVTCLVFFLHTQGIFQAAELSLYDTITEFRNVEDLDRRIVVVRVTPSDRTMQISQGEKLGIENISDSHLVQLLERLDEEKPKVIGMTFKRTNLSGDTSQNKKLVDRILNDKKPTLVLHCSMRDDFEAGYFPETMKIRKVSNLGDMRIGFSNSFPDEKYFNKNRRLMLIQRNPDDYCGSQARLSFSLRVVMQFLGNANEAKIKFIEKTGQVILNYRNVEIAGIVEKQGGYQIDPSLNPDPDYKAFPKKLSILFNHKKTQFGRARVLNLALDDVLSKRNSSLKDKIVLIGGTGEDNISINNLDYHALAVDYLLRVFEGEPILVGISNNISFWLYFANILCISLIFIHISLSNSLRQFIYTFILFSIYSFTMIYAYLLFVLKMSLWIPIVPALIGSTFSCLVLSFLYFIFYMQREELRKSFYGY